MNPPSKPPIQNTIQQSQNPQNPSIIKCKKCNKRHEFACQLICERCGRNTHEAPDCFAKKDLDGNQLDD